MEDDQSCRDILYGTFYWNFIHSIWLYDPVDSIISIESSTSYPAGEEATEYEVGSFILTHKNDFIGAMIRWGQGIRFRGPNRIYSYWNHTALIVSEEGDLVEALTKTGATRSHISKYKDVEFTICHTNTVPLDQKQIIRFADKVVGQKYSFLNDMDVFLNFLTGNKLTLSFQNTIMCSELVARAQERSGAWFDRNTSTISPADLAQYFSVTIPTGA